VKRALIPGLALLALCLLVSNVTRSLPAAAGPAISRSVPAVADYVGEDFRRLQCLGELDRIDAAKARWVKRRGLKPGIPVRFNQLVSRKGGLLDVPVCPTGGIYSPGAVGESPSCSLGYLGHLLRSR
jgi:hypothetical protein